ncbi:MAG: VanZ family protein, partial [Bryobacteraceae bacterium]
YASGGFGQLCRMTVPRKKLANPWWIAVAAWLGVIAFSSTSMAGQGSQEAFVSLSSILFRYLHPSYTEYLIIHFLADKGVHVALFAVLGILLWQAIPAWRWKPVVILVVGAFVGSCSEFLQSFFPGRHAEIRDVLINVGGTALGLGICFAISRLRRHRRQHTAAGPLCGKAVR